MIDELMIEGNGRKHSFLLLLHPGSTNNLSTIVPG